jgi:hypothetical protein
MFGVFMTITTATDKDKSPPWWHPPNSTVPALAKRRSLKVEPQSKTPWWLGAAEKPAEQKAELVKDCKEEQNTKLEAIGGERAVAAPKVKPGKTKIKQSTPRSSRPGQSKAKRRRAADRPPQCPEAPKSVAPTPKAGSSYSILSIVESHWTEPVPVVEPVPFKTKKFRQKHRKKVLKRRKKAKKSKLIAEALVRRIESEKNPFANFPKFNDQLLYPPKKLVSEQQTKSEPASEEEISVVVFPKWLYGMLAILTLMTFFLLANA